MWLSSEKKGRETRETIVANIKFLTFGDHNIANAIKQLQNLSEKKYIILQRKKLPHFQTVALQMISVLKYGFYFPSPFDNVYSLFKGVYSQLGIEKC